MNTRFQSFGYPFLFIAGKGFGFSYSSYTQITSPLPFRHMGRAKIDCLVNIANGNLIIIDKKINFTDIGGQIDFSYIYNSLSEQPWIFSFGRKVKFIEKNNFIIIKEKDGHETCYTFDSDKNRYVAPPHINGTPYIEENKGSLIWYHPESQQSEYFNSQGLLTKSEDDKGNEISYEYNAASEIVGIKTTHNYYEIQRNYPQIKIYLHHQDKATFIHSYLLDTDGKLLKSITFDGYEIQYRYSKYGKLTTLKQSDESLLQFEHAIDNKLKTIQVGSEENALYYFEYENNYRVFTNPLGVQTIFTIDSQTRLATVTQERGFDEFSKEVDVTQYGYDKHGHINKIIYPDLSCEEFNYEAQNGLLESKVDRNGIMTIYGYQPAEKPLLISLRHESNQTKAETRYIYQNFKDKFHILRYEISAWGRVKEYIPDNLTGLCIAENEFSELYYLENIPTLKNVMTWSSEQTDSTLSKFTLDVCGRIIKNQQFENENMQETRLSYDVFGNVTYQAVKYSNEDKFAYLENQYLNDSCNDLITEMIGIDTSAMQMTKYHFTGGITHTLLPNSAIKTDLYHSSGLLKDTMLCVDKDGKSESRIHQFSYDENGRIEKIILPDHQEIIQIYDRQNRLSYIISPKGAVTEFEYYSLERYEVKKQYQQLIDPELILCNGQYSATKLKILLNECMTEIADRVTINFYCLNGKIKYLLDSENYLTEYRYDDLANLAQTIVYARKLELSEIHHLKMSQTVEFKPNRIEDRITTTFYDKDGEIIAEQDPAGFVTEYQREGRKLITQKTIYSQPNLKISLKYEDIKPEHHVDDSKNYYFYNTFKQCILEVDAEGYLSQHHYSLDNKKEYSIRYASQIPLAWYDDTKNPPAIIASPNDQMTQWGYDELRRLVEVFTALGKLEFKHYNEMNQIISIDSIDLQKIHSTIGDERRRHEIRYDEWGQEIAIASPRIAEKLLNTLQQDLTFEEIYSQSEEIWQNEAEQRIYSESGLHTATIDSNGFATLFYYDIDRRQVLRIDPNGAVFEKARNTFGEIIAETQYYHCIEKDLVTLQGGYIDENVKQILANIKDIDHDSTTLYERDRRGKVIKKIDAESNIFQYGFSAFGQCIYENLPIRDDEHLEIQHFFDARGLESETIKHSAKLTASMKKKYHHFLGKETEIVDEVGMQITKQYDRLGRLINVIKKIEDDQIIVDQCIEYDAFHRPILKINALGHSTCLTYDDKNRETTIVYPIENMQVTIQENIFGEKIKVTDSAGITEIFSHDPDGQLKEIRDGLGNTKKIIYDNMGQKIQEYNPNNVLKEFHYNSMGQLVKCINDKEELNITTEYFPNVLGKNEKIIDPREVCMTQEFNRLGQLKKSMHDPLGCHREKKLEYNAAGKEIHAYEGDNFIHYHKKYDGFSRVIETILDPEELRIHQQYSYDNAGNITKEIDPNGFIQWNFYDLRQQKRFEVRTIDDTHISVIERSYTTTGKIESTRIYQSKYDAKIITAETKLSDLSKIFKCNENDTVNYLFYDKNDQERFKISLLYHHDEKNFYGVIEEKRYDLCARLIAHIKYAKTIAIHDVHAFSTEFIENEIIKIENPNEDRAIYLWYDDANQERFAVDQNGRVTEKCYDPSGKIIIHIQYATSIDLPEKLLDISEFQLAARVTRTSLDRTTYFVYDHLGYEIFKINANSVVTRKDYDENHNLISSTLFKNTIKIPDAYDQLVIDLASWIPNPDEDSITKKMYDNVNQLISVTDALGHQEHYEYDDVGNNIKFSNRLNQITNFYYDRAKRKTLEVYPSASYTKVYRNEHGKLFYETSYISPQKHINYDKNNNIIQITVGDGRDDYRVVKSKYNAYRQTLNTVVPAVNINDEEAHYDDSWQGLLTLPHRKVNLDTNTIYDTKGNIYAEKDENDHWTYKIYNSLNHVIFTINREKAITRYANNSFGNPLEEYHYAKPIDLDLNEYREVGLTAEIILQNIQTDENDRVTSFQYNQAGKLIQQQSNQIFYYSRGEYGLAKPTIRKEYNPFDDCIYEAKLIRQNIWSEKRSWFDKMKNIVAEVNENNYLTYYQFNSANKPTEIREYSEPFIVQPACSVDVNQLIEMITTSTKDRVHRYTYDALQQKKTETLLDVTTHKLILDDKNIPHIEQNPSKNLMKEWFYSPTQKIIKIQHVDGNEENFYYDAGDNRIAETEVVRQSVDDTGKSISILPMKQFKLNVFKEPVVLSTSPQGGIIEDNSPRLICDKPQDCIEEVRLYDNRGLIYLKQDNEQHLVGFTYQPFRKVARLLQEASNWRLSSDEKKIFNRENYIDEKEIFYNQNYQPNKINLRRNGRLVESTFNHYNVFGDSIGEGAAENKDSAIHRFDNVGSAWFTNGEKGVNTIIFRDLLGNETLRLQAPNDNLAEFSYDHLSTLLTWGADRVDFAETIHDQGGRVIAHKTPIWFKDCNSQPSRSYQYDRWNNVIKEINSLGFQTDYAFNSLDKMTQCIQPETDVYFENMTQSRVRPTAQHAYNERGFEIGIMDANAHVTGFILDNAGNILKNILPDGTIEETTIFDSLNRPTHLIDARNKVTQYFYNSKSQVTAQRYPSGRLIQYEYDERDNRVSYCDPADNTWRYNYDLQGNMIERFMPLGQATQVSYDRNHVKIAEVNPDNSKMTWDTDYFGNILKHRDLSGKILNSTYDFNKRVIRQSSEADAPRKMLMMNGPVTNMGFVVHNCNFANVPSEDISYRYHFGLLETVQDNSLNKTSTYAYNTESKRIFMQNKKSQMVMNEVTTEYDELDREVATQEQLLEASGYYSKMALKKGYDQVGNIRMNLFTLDPTCIMAKVNCRAPQQKSAFYYLYDNADRIRVLDGKFQENKIQQGVAIEYKNGFRHTENVYGSGVTTFEYDDDGRLTETIADNGMKTVRIYDPAGWTQAYQEILGSQSTQRHLNFNENGWQLTDDFFENNKQQTAMSYLNLTPLGLPTKQAIYDYKQKYNDVYEITYLGLDRWAQAKVTGKRNDGSLGTAEFWYDSHGIINGKSFSTQDEPQYQRSKDPDPFPTKFPLYYETTHDGLILSKQYITLDSHKAFEYDYFYHYLHNVLGDLYGGYYFLYDSSYNYSHPHNPNHSSYYFPKVSDGYAYHLPQSLSCFAIADKNKKMDPSWRDTTSDLVPFSPQTYIVNQNDTLESIAKKMFGDALYARKIAIINGLLHMNAPKPGLIIQLPQIIPERNKFNTAPSRPYYMFIDHLAGNLLPQFHKYQHRHKQHHGFFSSLIKIVAVGLVMVFAPEMGGVLLSLAGIAATPATLAVAAGVAGAIADAAAQGMAIAMGIQSQFSFAEMLETGVSAGAFLGMEAPKSVLSAAKTALHVGTVQVTTQLAEMAAGIRSKFDARAIGLQIAGTLASFQIAKQVKINSVLWKNVANTALNTVLGNVITNTPFNIKNIALQIAGGIITEFSSSLVVNDAEISEEVTMNDAVPEYISADLTAAEKVVNMPIPDMNLNFQNVSGDDIRQSRAIRWQTESTKRNQWADKHPESQAQNLIDQINKTPQKQDKTFMDRVKDFNDTVESTIVKPVLAIGDSIIQDINTVMYNDSLSAKIIAGGSLALDATMTFGLPEVGMVKGLYSSLSKFGLWGGATAETGIKEYSFKLGRDIEHYQKHKLNISTEYNLGSNYSIDEYIRDANNIITEGIYVPELYAYVKIPANSGGDKALAPFVGLDRMTNEITTFHLKRISFLEKNAPSLGWSAKPKSELTNLVGPNKELGWKYPYRKTP